MHIKVIDAGAQDFSEPVAQLIKHSSHGLLGIDRSNFIKRASDKLAHDVDRLLGSLKTGELLIHLLAVGATEDYGCNRNGDGFKRACCERYHPTFVKHARFYRNHKNKDRSKSYGIVKESEYNPKMRRIELICALNGTEAAALRNGGLLADKELEKLAAGKDIPVSMACRVPWDVCSYCDNKAPTAEDYCWGVDMGGRCKAGGLRDNMGAIVEIDGGTHQLHADNPDPTFFDISHVFRPADRIAYVSGMLKAASAAGHCVSGAALAQLLGVTLPSELAIDSSQPANVQRMLKAAYQLADLEQQALPTRFAAAFSPEVQEQAVSPPPYFREKLSLALRALADRQVLLPLDRWLECVVEYPREKAAEVGTVLRGELPGVYGRLLADANLPARLADCPYTPDVRQAPAPFAEWATKLAADYSLAESHIQRRLTLGSLRQVPAPALASTHEKRAAALPQAQRLAEEYALYTLGFLSANNDSPLTASLVVLQNCTE